MAGHQKDYEALYCSQGITCVVAAKHLWLISYGYSQPLVIINNNYIIETVERATMIPEIGHTVEKAE